VSVSDVSGIESRGIEVVGIGTPDFGIPMHMDDIEDHRRAPGDGVFAEEESVFRGDFRDAYHGGE
jgi:hypothetical protein